MHDQGKSLRKDCTVLHSQMGTPPGCSEHMAGYDLCSSLQERSGGWMQHTGDTSGCANFGQHTSRRSLEQNDVYPAAAAAMLHKLAPQDVQVMKKRNLVPKRTQNLSITVHL